MVQRKVANKLGIQADHVKSNKLLANLTTPSSPQHHDGTKTRGADLTKKMKKSRSIKRSDHMEYLRSSPPLRKEVAQPGKPPPLRVSTTAAASPQKPKQSPAKVSEASSVAVAPQKQSPGKVLEASPNYMKSTSSFDARKERSSPVSSRICQISLVHKTPSPKKSEKPKLSSSASGHKASRTSSLKLVRTLTKSPSFKPLRASKKCSPVALCEDLDVQKATCSSTLKDSKFPDYLELNPGGTELEGTSAMRVCPYTYCSLNGHHHAPLPPLKCFLSARRRMMKTQKSFKLGCLSPRRTRPSDIMKETDAGLVIPAEEPAIQQPNLEVSAIAPAPEEHKDFFIEIYRKDREDGSATIGMNKDSVHVKETVSEKADGEIVESLPRDSPHPDIDFGNFNQSSDASSIELDVGEFSPDYWMEEEAEELFASLSAQEETTAPPNNLSDQPDSEASDMEWEAGGIYDVPILKSPETNASIKKILDKEVLQGVYDEASVSSEAWLEDGDSDLDASYQNSVSDEFLILSNNQICDRLSPTTEETDGNTELDNSQRTESTCEYIEETMKGLKTASEDKNAVPEANNRFPFDLQLGDDEIQCTSNHGEDESPQELLTVDAKDETETNQVDAIKSMVKIEPFDSSEELTEADQERTTEDADESKIAAVTRDSEINQTFTDEGPSSKTQDDSSEKQSEANYDVELPDNPEKDQEEAKTFKLSNNHHSEDHKESGMLELRVNENNEQAVENMEVECANNCNGENACSTAKTKSSAAPKNLLRHVSSTSNEELLKTCTNLRIIRNQRLDEELEGLRDFNPREPNYLPVESDPEAEKVDLRHQMMDERKNAEEWMVDFALRQAVTRLAPARKKKVALLVEAFEKVTPIPKYQTHLRQTSRVFAHTRPMQACS